MTDIRFLNVALTYARARARYRQLGNAVAVPVAAWIARRIVAVESEAA